MVIVEYNASNCLCNRSRKVRVSLFSYAFVFSPFGVEEEENGETNRQTNRQAIAVTKCQPETSLLIVS